MMMGSARPVPNINVDTIDKCTIHHTLMGDVTDMGNLRTHHFTLYDLGDFWPQRPIGDSM